MSPADTADRYVTFGIFIPEGQIGYTPTVSRGSVPVWFPDPDDFFPKDVAPTYAIRNTVGETNVQAPDGTGVYIPAGGWWIYSWGLHFYAEDQYFSGGIPDVSGGTQYPPEGMRDVPVNPPQWVASGTAPAPIPADPGTGPGWQQQPDPGGGGMTPGDAPQAAGAPSGGSGDTTTTPTEGTA